MQSDHPHAGPDDLRNQKQIKVEMLWAVKIPMRDGIHLNATLYVPKAQTAPSPAVFTLTPYIGQTYHDQGVYFAMHGYPFLTVDVRGRGNSEGEFRPFIQEANDGHDIIGWLAQQPYCNGQVAMWGGSYAGYDQWAAAKEFPPALASLVPVASPYLGVDMPLTKNIPGPYLIQWLTLISGRTSQQNIFYDNQRFWSARFSQWFKAGIPFKEIDAYLGNPSAIFQEWIAHPKLGEYWDLYNPASDQYARVSVPILTICGIYDANQAGALMHHRKHMENATKQGRDNHYLVIGPWDHAGTRIPRSEVGGVKVGNAGLVDLPRLHLQWYAWTMQGGIKPAFLRKNVAYYVMGADKWRYANTLEAITAREDPYYLASDDNPTDVFRSGFLVTEPPLKSTMDCFIYDPSDVTLADLESTVDPASLIDHRMVYAAVGKHLVYHGAPFDEDTEISGFFRLSAWLSIDQPDTDFRVSVYEVSINGVALLLTTDWMRARYREGFRDDKLIRTLDPLRYDFNQFAFVSRRIMKRNRLRLVIGPMNSIYSEKNYNSGGVVAEESMKDARPVTVKLFHDLSHPSALYVPFGVPEP